MVRELARHALHTRLARDSVTDVWFARHDGGGASKSIVRVLAHDAVPAIAVDAWLREARIASEIRHQNLAQTLHVGEVAEPFVCSRYAPLVPLAELLGSRWTVDEVLGLVRPAAAALDVAAAEGVPHGAVHPRTIWVDRRSDRHHRRPLLEGFGLHHLLAAVAGSFTQRPPLDDYLYVAPELLRGAGPTGRSDQYALAAAVHHLLVGSPLFERRSQAALFGAHLFSRPRATSPGIDVAGDLDQILARALAKDPSDRYDHCMSFVAALREWHEAAARPTASGGVADFTPEPAAAPTNGVAVANGTAAAATEDRRAPSEHAVVAASPRREPNSGAHGPASRWIAALAGTLAVVTVVGIMLGRLITGPEEVPVPVVAAPTEQATTAPSGVRWRTELDADPAALHVTSTGVLVEAGGTTSLLDPETGEVRRAFDAGGGGVVTASGTYVTGGDGGLRAVDPVDGSVRWELAVEAPARPAAAEGTVYGVSDEEIPQLIAADADSGERLWAFPEDEPAFPAGTSVAPADDFVYLADPEAVYGILPAGKSVGEDTPLIDASEPASGPLCLWRHEVEQDLWTGSLLAVDGGVVVADRSGRVCLRGHVAGERMWCVRVEGVADRQPTVYASGDTVAIVTRAAMTGLDVRTGEKLWRREGPWRRTVRDGDRLVAVRPNGRFATVALTSGVLRRPAGVKVGAGAVLAVDDDTLYAARRNGTVLSVDLGR